MAVPTTGIHILRLLLQADQNLSGLQRDIRQNAQTWLAAATAQSIPLATLAQFMNDAATSYQTRLGWVTTAQANTPVWTSLTTMWTALGGTSADFSNLMNPLTTVANQLGPSDKSTYAAIITTCNSIISAIPLPLSLWPE